MTLLLYVIALALLILAALGVPAGRVALVQQTGPCPPTPSTVP